MKKLMLWGILCLALLCLGSTLLSGAWFGLDSCPSHWAVATGYADACRFQAPEEGTSTRLEILTWTSAKGSTFRLAVYDDGNGHPQNNGQSTVRGHKMEQT